MENGAGVRYKQDLAELISIAAGARLIQERSGLSEAEAREDIVFAVRDGTLKVECWSIYRGERTRCRTEILLSGLLRNLTSDLIDWDRSVARRHGVGYQFKVEIEVSRSDVCRLSDRLGMTASQNRKPATSEGATLDPVNATEAQRAATTCTKLKTERQYLKHVEQIKGSQHRYPTIEEDEGWRKPRGIKRKRLREMREAHNPRKKGGAHPRTPAKKTPPKNPAEQPRQK